MKFEFIRDKFSKIMCNTEGICGFISKNSSQYLQQILSNIENAPLTKVQFDQLLSLQRIKCVSDDFFRFYWLTRPEHFYKLAEINIVENTLTINSIEQLYWGFNRLFTDCLFVYGNIQKGFDTLANMSESELNKTFEKYKVQTNQIKSRGNTIHFNEIAKGDRYLISEMACKTFANIDTVHGLKNKLMSSYKAALKKGVKHPTYRRLLDGYYIEDSEPDQLSMFAATDILDEEVINEHDIEKRASELAERFDNAHRQALDNTDLYLSLVNDLDVYVATSMRTKENFVEMANFCENIFKSAELRDYDLRYFDPTISAADSHEDKGLIECLMVKSARMLIYSSGEKDSYGKDVEAAMAMCLGKPTIFYCTEKNGRAEFFRNVHPLSRLVNFETGVAGGVVVCETEKEVIEIVKRIFTNEMVYTIDKKSEDRSYYLLREESTGSIVRIQTDNTLLSSVFWNSYNKKNN